MLIYTQQNHKFTSVFNKVYHAMLQVLSVFRFLLRVMNWNSCLDKSNKANIHCITNTSNSYNTTKSTIINNQSYEYNQSYKAVASIHNKHDYQYKPTSISRPGFDT